MINKQPMTRFGLAGHEENKEEKVKKFILIEKIQIVGKESGGGGWGGDQNKWIKRQKDARKKTDDELEGCKSGEWRM